MNEKQKNTLIENIRYIVEFKSKQIISNKPEMKLGITSYTHLTVQEFVTALSSKDEVKIKIQPNHNEIAVT